MNKNTILKHMCETKTDTIGPNEIEFTTESLNSKNIPYNPWLTTILNIILNNATMWSSLFY